MGITLLILMDFVRVQLASVGSGAVCSVTKATGSAESQNTD